MILNKILMAFISIFVAVDAAGVLPIYISLTRDLEKKEKNSILIQSTITALLISIGFVFLSKAIFLYLGITISDFMIAGGIVLFCIAIIDILTNEKKGKLPSNELGVVPIGTPLIAGPALLTTCLIIIPEYGIISTLIAIFINILLAVIIFYFSDFIIKILGEIGTKAISKFTSLLLSAFAVMMIRKGIELITK